MDWHSRFKLSSTPLLIVCEPLMSSMKFWKRRSALIGVVKSDISVHR